MSEVLVVVRYTQDNRNLNGQHLNSLNVDEFTYL